MKLTRTGIRRFITTMIALTFTFTLAGCRDLFKRGVEQVIDKNKTQLYIGNYNGGLGFDWLRQVADAFEAVNTDVQVVINNEKDLFSDANLFTNIKLYNNDMYFVNAITYANFVGADLLLDVTDVVNSKVEGEDLTIKDKLNPTLRDYYETEDGKFYGLPFFDSLFGTVYDVDLFEQEGYYFNSNNELITYDKANSTLSAGPNGIVGDYDDGLPATYSQWETLMSELKSNGITPYIWTGQYEYYRQRFITAAWADYEGKSNFDLNFNLNGEYTFKGDTETTPITVENAYRLQEQYGKTYALNFAASIVKNRYYATESFNTTNSHTMAQQQFLLSVTGNNRIAMIFEGGWWENEAKPFFSTMEKKYGEEYGISERRFAFMPFPKADDGSSNPRTTVISSTGNSMVMINKSTQNAELAKAFFKFAHSDESLRTFTRVTGSVRPFAYNLTDSDLSEMTHYAKNMHELYMSETTDISYITLYNHPSMVEDKTFFGTNWLWKATISGSVLTEPFYEFSQNSNLTVEAYALGLRNSYTKAIWNSKMKGYYA